MCIRDRQLFYEERYSNSLFPIQPDFVKMAEAYDIKAVSYTHLRAHETLMNLVCRLLLEKKNIFLFFFFFNDTATHKIYTILFVGSVRCV